MATNRTNATRDGRPRPARPAWRTGGAVLVLGGGLLAAGCATDGGEAGAVGVVTGVRGGTFEDAVLTDHALDRAHADAADPRALGAAAGMREAMRGDAGAER